MKPDLLDPFFRVINTVTRVLLIIIFVVMWIIVFGRYFLSWTPVWGEEIILLSMAWLSALSGAEALRNDQHIKITLIDRFVSPRFIAVQQVIYDIAVFAVSVYLARYAWITVLANRSTRSMGLKIPEAVAFAAIFVAFVLFAVIKVERYISPKRTHRGH